MLKLGVASEDVLVSVNQLDSLQRVLHTDDFLSSDQSANFNSGLHTFDSRLDVFINELVTVGRNVGEMDRLLIQSIVWAKSVSQVLVEVLRHKRCDWCH